jgi:ribosome-associated toxin RatA of RatAB toxin-antitoxin module
VADSVSDTIDVAASTDRLFEVATDFEAYPEWNANIKNVAIRERDAQGRAKLVWYEVDAKIKKLEYVLEYDYSDAPDAFSWKLVDGDVKELRGSYRFDEFDDVTEVQYEMAIDPGFKVPGMLKRQAEKQIVKGALEDLKKRVEASP